MRAIEACIRYVFGECCKWQLSLPLTPYTTSYTTNLITVTIVNITFGLIASPACICWNYCTTENMVSLLCGCLVMLLCSQSQLLKTEHVITVWCVLYLRMVTFNIYNNIHAERQHMYMDIASIHASIYIIAKR